MSIPSLNVMEILALSDRAVFEHNMSRIGLKVIGEANTDPLENNVQAESVAAIASAITDDIHTPVTLDPARKQIKEMAEFHGYIVAIMEGHEPHDDEHERNQERLAREERTRHRSNVRNQKRQTINA